MTAAVVGLTVGAASPELDLLIDALGRQATVVNPVGYHGRLDWLLEFRSPYPALGGAPRVVYLAEDSDLVAAEGAAGVLGTNAELLDRGPVRVPRFRLRPNAGAAAVPFGAVKPFAPYPRDRIRRARGLPAAPVGEVTADGCRWDGAAVADALADTVLAAAAAVVVDSTTLLRALAWAAPVVTDPDAAAAVDAVPDRHVLVGSDPQTRQRLAAALALDMPLAARLSWAGRMLFEEHSPAHLAARIGWTVGAGGAVTGPAARIERVLAELGTPADAPIRKRAAARSDLPTQTRRLRGAR